jgi:hypothetical protein
MKFWGKGTFVRAFNFVMMEVILIQIHLALIYFSFNAREQWPQKTIVFGMMVFGFGLCNGLG